MKHALSLNVLQKVLLPKSVDLWHYECTGRRLKTLNICHHLHIEITKNALYLQIVNFDESTHQNFEIRPFSYGNCHERFHCNTESRSSSTHGIHNCCLHNQFFHQFIVLFSRCNFRFIDLSANGLYCRNILFHSCDTIAI